MSITPEMIRSCICDDRKAINSMYEYCFHLLMPVCFRYNQNEEDARASYNIGFIKILKALDKVDETVNFNAWVRRIMVNTLIDEYRKNKKYAAHVTKSSNERDLDYFSERKVNEAESNLGYENIIKLVGELPRTMRNVFSMYVIEGYSHKEISEALEMSEGTSKWHLSSARKILREKLEKLENHDKRMVV